MGALVGKGKSALGAEPLHISGSNEALVEDDLITRQSQCARNTNFRDLVLSVGIGSEYKITELGITRTLALKSNQVILDESFIRSGNVQRLCAKRRFTLAHECAHQILFQLESEEDVYKRQEKKECRKSPFPI